MFELLGFMVLLAPIILLGASGIKRIMADCGGISTAMLILSFPFFIITVMALLQDLQTSMLVLYNTGEIYQESTFTNFEIFSMIMFVLFLILFWVFARLYRKDK